MANLGNAPLTVLRRIVSRFSRTRLDDELREEMESHIALRRAALVREGMDPRRADAEARRLFGNATVLREETRDLWGFPAIESVLQDVRYGARMLLRTPVFTAVAVVSIAGGLTAGTGIFAFLNAVIYRPIGVGGAQHFYRIFTSDHSGRSRYGGSSYLDFEAYRDAPGVFASACATENVLANVGVGGVAALHHGEIVSPGCFDALQLTPQLGRFFTEERGTLSGPPPVVISHGLWARRFARDSSVVGRTFQLNGMFAVVAAVAPQGFAGTSLDGGADFWARIDIAPVVLPPGTLTGRGQRRFTVYARPRDGVSRERAEAALAGVAAQLRRLDAESWTTESGGTRTVTLMREAEARFAGSPGAVAGIVASVVASIGIIVAIACLNLATMLLARGAARSKEISIRLAIGASRGRVLRQLATESLMIAVVGAGAAIAAVAAGIRLFSVYRPTVIPAFDIALDWRVLSFAIALAAVAALLFGLAPALHTLRLALTDGLKSRVFAPRIRWLRVGAREALIVLQVAVSIALLLVSTLFVKAIAGGSALSPGFSVANIAIVRVDLEAIADSDVANVTARLVQAAEAVPGSIASRWPASSR